MKSFIVVSMLGMYAMMISMVFMVESLRGDQKKQNMAAEWVLNGIPDCR